MWWRKKGFRISAGNLKHERPRWQQENNIKLILMDVVRM
jgi:menaquinone-dependent protoporphyrinogen IX oxidase